MENLEKKTYGIGWLNINWNLLFLEILKNYLHYFSSLLTPNQDYVKSQRINSQPFRW